VFRTRLNIANIYGHGLKFIYKLSKLRQGSVVGQPSRFITMIFFGNVTVTVNVLVVLAQVTEASGEFALLCQTF
jgi:hypothetical protein